MSASTTAQRPVTREAIGAGGARLLPTLLGRVALGIGVVVVTAAISFAIPRWARPQDYVGETGLSGVVRAMERAFLHLDFGVACGWPGCPKIHDMWARGYAADIWMLFGTVAIGVSAGFGLGLWCAARSGSRRARVVQTAASLLYCAPVYAVGLGLLMLFHPDFGRWPLPYFFDASPVWASPFSAPWDWLRTLLVPWLVAAAPVAAMCLRLVVALVEEQMDADPVRTAIAKGVPHQQVVRRHAGRFAHGAVASLVSVSAPFVVTNLILVERLFSVPGFFFHTWKATGHTQTPSVPPVFDYDMLAAIAIWASVFIVALSFAAEFALQRLDPRIGTAKWSHA